MHITRGLGYNTLWCHTKKVKDDSDKVPEKIVAKEQTKEKVEGGKGEKVIPEIGIRK